MGRAGQKSEGIFLGHRMFSHAQNSDLFKRKFKWQV